MSILAVLCVLASIQFSRIRTMSQEAICTENLRRMASGFALYAADHNGELPIAFDLVTYPSDQRGSFAFALWPYVETTSFNYPENDLQGDRGRDRNIFHCPVTKNQPVARISEIRVPGAAAGAHNLFSYAMNGTPSKLLNGSPYIPYRIAQIAKPSQTALVLEQDENPANYGMFTASWGYGLAPHRDRSNVLFVDGHVSSLLPKDFSNSASPLWTGQ